MKLNEHDVHPTEKLFLLLLNVELELDWWFGIAEYSSQVDADLIHAIIVLLH